MPNFQLRNFKTNVSFIFVSLILKFKLLYNLAFDEHTS